ncbi:MAG TPA: hypothetical protein G4O00_04995 [Thermoflexia bacterium]|jgi:hypothetical protein|nr:hypothetical protein [Thermoflexia bacterium]
MNRTVWLSLTLILATGALALLLWGITPPASATAVQEVHYVAPEGDCGGVSPCYATIQEAVDAAAPGDEIRVAQGVYTDTTTRRYGLGGLTWQVTQTVFISKSLILRGGYTTTSWATARPSLYPTVINPQGKGRGIYVVLSAFDVPLSVTLEGFSVTGGFATGDGGGLYLYATDAQISGCHFYGNEGQSIGSGVYLSTYRLSFTNNLVERNTGATYGYGVVVSGGKATLEGNRVVSNSNGLFLWNSIVTMTNNILAGNGGNGLAISGGEVRAWHTTLADNHGEAVDVTNSGQTTGSLAMTNTIIAGEGVGVQVRWFATVRLASTLWNVPTPTKTMGEGWSLTHVGDLTGDPAFVGGGDYHITAGSPARNRGVPSFVKWDIDGEPRDPLPDLGADEYPDPGSIQQVYLPLIQKE